MTTPFPLLRLPRLALIPVFQSMELMEVIVFSLISKRTHNLSKRFCKTIYSRYIDLEIENNCLCMKIALIDESLLALYFYADISKTVEVFYRNEKVQWKNTGLSTKQWIERVFDITKSPLLRKLMLKETVDYDVLSFLSVVPKVSNLHISHNCTNTFATKALQTLSPVTSSITLFKLPFSNREEFQRFWMENVNCLCIRGDDLSSFQFNIDDLLASNAVSLDLTGVPMGLRELNRFFSCWLNKASNHRLKHLSVNSFEDINEDVLLDGLGARQFTEFLTREFLSIKTFYHFLAFTGGFKVRRTDGKLATITFGNIFEKKFINFDVWP